MQLRDLAQYPACHAFYLYVSDPLWQRQRLPRADHGLAHNAAIWSCSVPFELTFVAIHEMHLARALMLHCITRATPWSHGTSSLDCVSNQPGPVQAGQYALCRERVLDGKCDFNAESMELCMSVTSSWTPLGSARSRVMTASMNSSRVRRGNYSQSLFVDQNQPVRIVIAPAKLP